MSGMLVATSGRRNSSDKETGTPVNKRNGSNRKQSNARSDSVRASSVNSIENLPTSMCNVNLSAQIQKLMLKKINDMEFVDNGYPKTTCSPAARKFLEIAYFSKKDEKTSGRFLQDANTKCVLCYESRDADGDDELITCQGTMGGTVRKVPCKSKFHKNCAIWYNSNDYLFQYAARPECQNKLLCPLHCCAACNVNHKKQSAYIDNLSECALCLRSFHTKSCLPAGMKRLDVEIEINGKPTVFEMLVCPAHHFAQKPQMHIKACRDCHKTKNLVKCVSCVRSFHVKCHDVQIIDKNLNPMNRCEMCLCQDVIRFNVPVVVRWHKMWWLAITRNWNHFPIGKRSSALRFGNVGYTVVEWYNAKMPDGTAMMSIMPVNEMAELVQYYIRPPMIRNSSDRTLWEKILYEFDAFENIPLVLKQVNRILPTSRSTKKITYRCMTSGLCNCSGPARCATDECVYVSNYCECPPECSRDGRVCYNRGISERRVHPNIVHRDAGKKGYGLFATAPIKAGEFLAEYIGEVIDNAEKQRRLRVIGISKDFQANHFMLSTLDGMTIDATVAGNVGRYINHSCDPNSMAFSRRIFVKNGPEDDSFYEARSFIKTIRDVKAGEEISFNYRMNEAASLPPCKCGAANCTGVIALAAQMQELEEEESSDDEEVVQNASKANVSDEDEEPKIKKRRRLTHIGESSGNQETTPLRKSTRQSMMQKNKDVKPKVEEEQGYQEGNSAESESWKEQYQKARLEREARAINREESKKRLESINLLGFPVEMERWASDYCKRFELEEPGTVNGNREVHDVAVSEYEQLRRILNRTPTLDDFLSDDEAEDANMSENFPNAVE